MLRSPKDAIAACLRASWECVCKTNGMATGPDPGQPFSGRSEPRTESWSACVPLWKRSFSCTVYIPPRRAIIVLFVCSLVVWRKNAIVAELVRFAAVSRRLASSCCFPFPCFEAPCAACASLRERFNPQLCLGFFLLCDAYLSFEVLRCKSPSPPPTWSQKQGCLS